MGGLSKDVYDDDIKWKEKRIDMVEHQIKARGIKDENILNAFLRVKRHLFIPEENRRYAYEDHPVSIGYGQTISQPFIVALMTQLLNPFLGAKVLEIGTGSGYQAAILAELGCKVFTVERVKPLAERAKALLKELGYSDRIKVRYADGYEGWPEEAPFDRIIITAASPSDAVKNLLNQLKVGGILVAPVEEGYFQTLKVYKKESDDKILVKDAGMCVFVPLLKGVKADTD